MGLRRARLRMESLRAAGGNVRTAAGRSAGAVPLRVGIRDEALLHDNQVSLMTRDNLSSLKDYGRFLPRKDCRIAGVTVYLAQGFCIIHSWHARGNK